MKKDCAYYEKKLRAIQDKKYKMIAEHMKAHGGSHEQIVQAIMVENAKDVHTAIHIGEDPSTN